METVTKYFDLPRHVNYISSVWSGDIKPLPVNLIISCWGIIIKEKNEPLPIKLLRYFLFILRALIANNGHDNNSVVMKGLQYYQI